MQIKSGVLVVFGAILVQVSIGAVYTWSLFNDPLQNKYGWAQSSIVLTFSIVIAVFAFTTIFAGKLQDSIGPKWVAMGGGILLGLGLTLSSRASSIIELHLYYGVIGGIGIGAVYVCPLATCVKWFPNNKGFITGITVGAFGLGSLIFKSITLFLINSKGVSQSFAYLGIIYMVLIITGACFLKVPSKKIIEIQEENELKTESNFTFQQMLHTKVFYLLWVMFFCGCISGLMIIGLATNIGKQLIQLPPEQAANAVAMIALFNALGRVSWGTLSDKIGRLSSLFIMYIITALAMLILSFMNLNYTLFFSIIACIAFTFGGFVSVFPSITADYYGIKNLGVNYGIIYQAYGIAAIAGPVIASSIDLKYSFIIAAIMAILGLSLTILVKSFSRVT